MVTIDTGFLLSCYGTRACYPRRARDLVNDSVRSNLPPLCCCFCSPINSSLQHSPWSQDRTGSNNSGAEITSGENNNTIIATNRIPQTKSKKVRSAYVHIKIHLISYAKRVAAETETEETA